MRGLQPALPDSFRTQVTGPEDHEAASECEQDQRDTQSVENGLAREDLIQWDQAGWHPAGDSRGGEGDDQGGGEQHVDDRQDVGGL